MPKIALIQLTKVLHRIHQSHIELYVNMIGNKNNKKFKKYFMENGVSAVSLVNKKKSK